MNTYQYITTALGPAKHHNSLEDAINWMTDYAKPAPMVESPHLHIELDGTRIGDLYIVDRDVKIMSGEEHPDVIHICHLLRNAFSRKLMLVNH